jgi:DNA repair exonuclease SbcCD ATPase subunit
MLLTSLLQQISKASVQAYDELDKKIRQSQKSAQKKSEQVSRNVEESEQLTQDLKGLRKDEQTRLKIIGELEKKIEKLKPLVEKGEPEENDTRELDAKLVRNPSLCLSLARRGTDEE